MKNVGVISMGIKAPIVKEGDDLADIVVKSVLEATWNGYTNKYDLNDRDVLGITESIVARNQGNYVTVDEIAEEIKKKFNNPDVIVVDRPIYSRNRFSMILKAIARAAGSGVIFIMPEIDEVGNPSGVNPWTGVDIGDYYMMICFKEGKQVQFVSPYSNYSVPQGVNVAHLYCGLHDYQGWYDEHCPADERESGEFQHLTLANICSDKCEYGLLGSNKATEEMLKLFPNKEKAQKLVEDIQERILKQTGKKIEVCVYGDGAFKDPVANIWEFADPITMPAYTNSELFESSPNEIKIKYLADNKYGNLKGEELNEAIQKEIENVKGNSLKGNMISEGTTPRLYRDLLASLMDLTSGSGMRATPFVLIKNYFN